MLQKAVLLLAFLGNYVGFLKLLIFVIPKVSSSEVKFDAKLFRRPGHRVCPAPCATGCSGAS